MKKNVKKTNPLLEVLSDLVKNGVQIRLIHAKEPGAVFRKDFDKYPALIDGIERQLCPRVHFKIIIFDLKKGIISSIIIIAGFFICATAFAQIEQKIIKCLSRFFYSREKNK